jgi:acyl-CoA thioester hydrolase
MALLHDVLEMDVRDYELDIQGIVNNTNYQHYLEHARHVFIKKLGIDFAALAKRGIDLVVIRAELDYKRPLVSGDRFRVESKMVKLSPVRFCFEQNILRVSDNALCLEGKIFATALNERRRPCLPEEFERLFVDHA